MILTLKITLMQGPYAPERWEGTFEVHFDSLLEDIHSLIQSALEFDSDHLYEFFVSRREQSSERVTFDEENGRVYDTAISDLYPLPKGRHLYYLFDHGDNWIFRIARTQKPTKAPVLYAKYPRLLSESGTRPTQYRSENENDS